MSTPPSPLPLRVALPHPASPPAGRSPLHGVVRPAAEADLPAIATLYRHYVDHTAATWAAPGEFVTPAAFRERWKAGSSRGLPWLVLVVEGGDGDAGGGDDDTLGGWVAPVPVPEGVHAAPGPHHPGYAPQEPLPPRAVVGPTRLLGYAYVGDFRPRAGWSITVEDSIYLAPGWGRAGLGSALLGALLGACRAVQPPGALRTVVAAVSVDPSDPALGAGSVALHTGAGFAPAGRLVGAGVKFGRRMDNVFLQLQL